MILKQNQIFHFDSFCDARGELFVFENNDSFSVQRIFFIQHVPHDAVRGNHATMNSNEILILNAGSCQIDLMDGHSQTSISLKKTMDAVFIPKRTWRKLHTFTSDCALTVLADHPYSKADIITDYEEYLKTVC